MEIIRKSLTKCETKERAKCRKWRLRIVTKNGEQSRRFNGTYTQGKEALARYVDEVEEAPEQELTFSAYAEKWITYREKCGDYARRTTNKNRHNINALNIHLADTLLTDIKPETIRDMYVAMKNGETPSGKPYSGTTLNQVHTVLHMILEQATTDELINRNPLAQIKPPKADTKERHALTKEQMQDFIHRLDKRTLRGQIVGAKLAILTGMRRSEICAVRWCDYDGSNLHINNAAEDNGELKAPKTKKSIRVLPLTRDMRDTLDRWYKVQAQRLLKQGIQRTDDFYIVTEKHGSGVQPWSLGKWWSRNRKSFGLDGVTLHELRHSYITRLVHSGVNIKAAQDLAGHSKADMIMEIYAHTDEDKKREAVELFELELGGANG